MGKFGFSFSWKRATGLSAAKGRLSRKLGIPLSRSGRQRKVGRGLGCAVLLAIAGAWILAAAVSMPGCGGKGGSSPTVSTPTTTTTVASTTTTTTTVSTSSTSTSSTTSTTSTTVANPSGFPACSGSRPNASCGLATGQCNNGDFTCSQNRQGTCSSNGGIRCVYCPGPLCTP